MRDIQECMRQLGLFSGLLINIGKCGIVIKGPLHMTDQALVEETRSGEPFLGIAVCRHIKYLGVVMGNISSDEAFSFPLAGSMLLEDIITDKSSAITSHLY